MATCRICSANNPPGAQRCASCGSWLDLANEAGREPTPSASPDPAAKPVAPTDPTEAQVVALMTLGRKIEAIKVYRALTGAGLKDAKDAVEQIAQRYGIAPGSMGGCAVSAVLLLGLLLCAGAATAMYLLARP